VFAVALECPPQPAPLSRALGALRGFDVSAYNQFRAASYEQASALPRIRCSVASARAPQRRRSASPRAPRKRPGAGGVALAGEALGAEP